MFNSPVSIDKLKACMAEKPLQLTKTLAAIQEIVSWTSTLDANEPNSTLLNTQYFPVLYPTLNTLISGWKPTAAHIVKILDIRDIIINLFFAQPRISAEFISQQKALFDKVTAQLLLSFRQAVVLNKENLLLEFFNRTAASAEKMAPLSEQIALTTPQLLVNSKGDKTGMTALHQAMQKACKQALNNLLSPTILPALNLIAQDNAKLTPYDLVMKSKRDPKPADETRSPAEWQQDLENCRCLLVKALLDRYHTMCSNDTPAADLNSFAEQSKPLDLLLHHLGTLNWPAFIDASSKLGIEFGKTIHAPGKPHHGMNLCWRMLAFVPLHTALTAYLQQFPNTKLDLMAVDTYVGPTFFVCRDTVRNVPMIVASLQFIKTGMMPVSLIILQHCLRQQPNTWVDLDFHITHPATIAGTNIALLLFQILEKTEANKRPPVQLVIDTLIANFFNYLPPSHRAHPFIDLFRECDSDEPDPNLLTLLWQQRRFTLCEDWLWRQARYDPEFENKITATESNVTKCFNIDELGIFNEIGSLFSASSFDQLFSLSEPTSITRWINLLSSYTTEAAEQLLSVLSIYLKMQDYYRSKAQGISLDCTLLQFIRFSVIFRSWREQQWATTVKLCDAGIAELAYPPIKPGQWENTMLLMPDDRKAAINSYGISAFVTASKLSKVSKLSKANKLSKGESIFYVLLKYMEKLKELANTQLKRQPPVPAASSQHTSKTGPAELLPSPLPNDPKMYDGKMDGLSLELPSSALPRAPSWSAARTDWHAQQLRSVLQNPNQSAAIFLDACTKGWMEIVKGLLESPYTKIASEQIQTAISSIIKTENFTALPVLELLLTPNTLLRFGLQGWRAEFVKELSGEFAQFVLTTEKKIVKTRYNFLKKIPSLWREIYQHVCSTGSLAADKLQQVFFGLLPLDARQALAQAEQEAIDRLVQERRRDREQAREHHSELEAMMAVPLPMLPLAPALPISVAAASEMPPSQQDAQRRAPSPPSVAPAPPAIMPADKVQPPPGGLPASPLSPGSAPALFARPGVQLLRTPLPAAPLPEMLLVALLRLVSRHPPRIKMLPDVQKVMGFFGGHCFVRSGHIAREMLGKVDATADVDLVIAVDKRLSIESLHGWLMTQLDAQGVRHHSEIKPGRITYIYLELYRENEPMLCFDIVPYWVPLRMLFTEVPSDYTFTAFFADMEGTLYAPPDLDFNEIMTHIAGKILHFRAKLPDMLVILRGIKFILTLGFQFAPYPWQQAQLYVQQFDIHSYLNPGGLYDHLLRNLLQPVYGFDFFKWITRPEFPVLGKLIPGAEYSWSTPDAQQQFCDFMEQNIFPKLRYTPKRILYHDVLYFIVRPFFYSYHVATPHFIPWFKFCPSVFDTLMAEMRLPTEH